MEYLSKYQKKIYQECLEKGNGGISLPMGSGKTLISILVALNQSPDNYILVICSKSLVHGWEHEIKKFFSESLKYEILHPNSIKSFDMWKPKDDTRLILTTSNVIAKQYREHNISSQFVEYRVHKNGYAGLQTTIKYYLNPKKPFLNYNLGGGLLFSLTWGCLIIDEAQNYTNIDTKRCQGIASIYAKHRWALSGTLFNEPKIERILGYYTILDIPNVPRNLPDLEKYVKHWNFKGLNSTCVYRKTNEMFIPPKVNEIIVDHRLSFEEAQLYVSIKATLKEISYKVRQLRIIGDTAGVRTFSSYLLAIITYLRQSLVCPLIPVANIAIDMADYQNKSQLSEILMKHIDRLNLKDWMENEDSIKSSRVTKILEVIAKHSNEKIVLFSCFRTSINVVNYFINDNRPIFILDANMSIEKRNEIHESFENTVNGILMLTYEIGSVGLNLQCSAIVLLLDFWWNGSTTKQAIARVLRYGQKSEEVDIYYFTSNTGLEKAIFKKQLSKFAMVEELQLGPLKTSIPKMTVSEILQIINCEDNTQLLENILEY